jgi:hypothetical protein
MGTKVFQRPHNPDITPPARLILGKLDPFG